MDEVRAEVAEQTWNVFGEWAALQNRAPMPLEELYGAARAACPVKRISMPDGSPAWAVLGQAEVDKVLMDTGRFSNEMNQFGPTRMIPMESDPPEHTPYRRILNRLIDTKKAEQLTPAVRGYVGGLLQPLLDAGCGDLRPVAEELTLRVLCRLVGVPDSEWTVIQESQAGRKPGEVANTTEEAVKHRFAALVPVIDYAHGLIEQRRASPEDDLVTGLLQSKIGDRPLSDDESLQMLMLVLLGGHETTRSALLSAVMLLALNPDVQARLRADPSLIPQAVEECLRIEGPVQGLFRLATEDVELAGQRISRGELVMPFFGAANHDPAYFERPTQFDIDRPKSRNYAFGRGTHLCVGAPIARMEMRVFIEELLARTSSFAITGSFEREGVPDLSFRRLELTLR
ncbi:cytochrome P450 [Aquisediminimonas profunda]|uniref:cytochrome P450 n=1 Tax=Aquisediminimonas profunda TaxID=1550733 RepID=UPI001C631423|nr:cytochrome P450 [Aquisediminimonas profunda]